MKNFEQKRWILHLDIDAFFASVEVLLNPSLKGKPIVVGGLAHERGVAATASYEARKYGVYSGMPLQEARRLCPRCIFLKGNFRLYSYFSERFFSILSRFTPYIEKASLDEAYLDLTPCTLIYPSIPEKAREIKETAQKELGLSISAGLASNRLLAKLATKRAKPGGFFWLSGDPLKFLKDLPVSELPGVGPKALEVLRSLHIETIGDLRSLSRKSLKEILGLWGEHLYFAARGMDKSEIKERVMPKSLSRETTFPEDIWEWELLEAHLLYLADRLSWGLYKEGLRASKVELKVRFSNFKTLTKTKKLKVPTRSALELHRAALKLFRPIYEKSNLAFRLLGIGAKELSPGLPLELFRLGENEKSERIERALFTIRDRFGFNAIMPTRELFLREVYPLDPGGGLLLKTASLTR